MEAEDDSVLDCNFVSLRSEIHPLALDSLGDSLCSSDLIFPVGSRCEKGLNCVFLSGVL